MEAEDTVALGSTGGVSVTNGSQPDGRALAWRKPAMIAGAVVAIAGAIAGGLVTRRIVRRVLRYARFAFRVATFRVYRRCPSCAARVRREARVCRYCSSELR